METKLGIAVFVVLCLSWQVGAASVNCTAAGRFADPTDTTCQNYTLCVLNTTSSTYISYDYVCPTTSVFNPNTARCTDPANYECNVTLTNNTSTSACTAEGFFADSNSTTCETYIQCVEINGTYTETTLTCPNSTFFNPNTTLCETNYTCSTNDTSDAFSCSAAGRFANTADTTCQQYYLCVLASNGTYVQYEYTCPSTSVFNPTTRLCTGSYVCPTA